MRRWDQRSVLVVLVVTIALLAGACGTSPSRPNSADGLTSSSPSASPVAARPVELPRGGRTVFPRFRMVALYGAADGGGLGALGLGTPDQAARRLDQQADTYARPDRPVLPVMELIVTIADPSPGPDGCFAHATDIDDGWRYLRAARAHRQMLVLDVQPGRCDFLSQTRRWEPLLAQPDVGLALDAEWRMPAGAVPGQEIGTVSAAEINTVTSWLADLTRRRALPQKPVLLHQFTPDMITDRDALASPPELAVISHTDGFGSIPDKTTKYRALTNPRLHSGFKLFYTQDKPLMSPAQVLGLQPPPDFISYQ
ncbi:hypothetical protein [Williamsia phyllosphaerae]|uniref:Lipoprotein n=1 Tax=Williamsia phyllosphaerae TaxID=885042 RepID=A0ABQ1UG61_9NOCA|nr:hypothetical protein [Williamsia phyllosphaerae]GGF18109.1 hypothetical protein GCM10007298_12680 [Williamsia phyllosphaerae]